MYTIDSLTPINRRYIYGGYHGHRINEEDVNKVNSLVKLIEARNHENPVPTVGDLVICETSEGKVISSNGHLEPVSYQEEGELSVCTEPYTPFVSEREEGGVYANASGGYWVAVTPEQLAYKGKQKKLFCTWGHMGMEWDGAIDFQAEVSVWRVRSERFY